MTIAESSIGKDIYEQFTRIVGPQNVSKELPSRMAYSRGVWPVELKRAQLEDWSYLPDLVIWPGNTQDVVDIILLAQQHHLPLVPYGGGSGIVGGTCLPKAVIVDLKRFDHRDLNESNLTVTVGSGLNAMHLEEWLNARGYTFGHFPQSMNSACIGGLIATASIGTFSGRYGRMDDLLIGLEAVLPNGSVLQTRAIPRRSSGPNLNQLFIGSEGAFGIITQAVLRVWPKPQTREWAVYTFPGTAMGLMAIRTLAQSEVQPALVRLYDEAESAARVARFGFAVGHVILMLGFEGHAEYVSYQQQCAEMACRRHHGQSQEVDAALHWYRYRFDTSGMLQYNQKPGGVADALEVAAPWDRLEAVWSSMRKALEPLCEAVHCHFSHVYPNEGSVYVIFYALAEENTPQAAIQLYNRCLEAAMEACLKEGGSISHHHGIGRSKHPYMEQEHGLTGLNLLRTLKQAVDPENILNPGVMGI